MLKQFVLPPICAVWKAVTPDHRRRGASRAIQNTRDLHYLGKCFVPYEGDGCGQGCPILLDHKYGPIGRMTDLLCAAISGFLLPDRPLHDLYFALKAKQSTLENDK